MLGAVAILYFFATALAMAVACAGPDTRAKFCSAYLMIAWGLSNRIFITSAPEDALAQFSFWDVLAAIGIWWALLRWPSRWMAALLAALSTQVIFQLIQRFGAGDVSDHFWVNELLYCAQLIAVTTPTIAQFRRRRRARRARERARPRGRSSWPPPYDGWQPPAR